MEAGTARLTGRRCAAVALTSVLVLSAAACSDDDDDAVAATATSCDETAVSEERREADPEEPGTFVMDDVRHEVVESGCERIILDLEPVDDAADLGYSVSYRQGPLPGPSGPIEVDGESILEIVIQETSARDRDLDAPEPATDSEIVVDIVRLPEVPGGLVWAFGVAQRVPFTVDVDQSSPSQLIVTLTASAP